MIDNAWLMKQAALYNCLLQMTGGQEEHVCEYYLQLARKNGMPSGHIWLENAGEYANASDPQGMAKLINRYHLRGLDYTHTRWLFNDDHETPKQPLYKELMKARQSFSKPLE